MDPVKKTAWKIHAKSTGPRREWDPGWSEAKVKRDSDPRAIARASEQKYHTADCSIITSQRFHVLVEISELTGGGGGGGGVVDACSWKEVS
jgi:hypothetical protein